MALPKKYAWLLKEQGPKMLVEALRHYGVLEYMRGSNPNIMKWAAEVGVKSWYLDDSVPWCGLFIGVVAKRCDYEFPASKLLSSLAWQAWGEAVSKDGAELGYVMIFTRGRGMGHVALYVGEDKDCFHVLGGNQSNAVTITRMPKSRLVAVRKPKYKIGEPSNVRKIYLAATGEISSTEQ
jgi:uncharacterized protein (TIGR02594 family)